MGGAALLPSVDAISDVEVALTAAIGDQLFATFVGGMNGPTTFAETVAITGGTGCFVGAFATVHETGWFDPDTLYKEHRGRPDHLRRMQSGVGLLIADSTDEEAS